MKKIAVVLVFLNVFAFAAFAQTARNSRPRIVPTASPTPTVAAPIYSSTPNNSKQAPVLKGGANSPAQTANNPNEEAVEDDEVIRVDTSLVTIPVSVITRDGKFVTGLEKKDFKIFENGVEQQIDSFATTQQPFTVVLLIDVSPSTAYQINEIHDAAISFVNQLRSDDKVIVMSFDERVRVLSSPTSDRNILRRAIEQAQFGDGTSLYEAVDNTIRQQLQQIQGRKAVVLFTDGVDTTSRRASYQSTIQQTQETDVLFFPIRYDTYEGNFGGGGSAPQQSGGGILGKILGGILTGGSVQIGGGGNSGSRGEYETGRRYLEELARNSGGRMFEANQENNLDAAFSGIAEELRRQYSLGYYPAAVGKTGERKQVKVRVLQPNLAVRAKDNYIVGEAEKKVVGK